MCVCYIQNTIYVIFKNAKFGEIIVLHLPRNFLQKFSSIFFYSFVCCHERGTLNQTKMSGITCKVVAPNFSFRVLNFVFHISYTACALILPVKQQERVTTLFLYFFCVPRRLCVKKRSFRPFR